MEKNSKKNPSDFFNRFIKDQIFCGLDLGSQTIKASVVRAEDSQNLDLLGVYEVKTMGFKNASVNDLGELTECVSKVLAGVAKKTGQTIKTVYLGVGGDCLKFRRSQATIPLIERGSKVIGELDIRKINHQGKLLGTQLEEEVVHAFPVSYKVDDVNLALNPIGLYGRKLSVDMLLVVGHGMRMRNLSKAVNHAGYEVADIYFNSYAASQVSLEDEYKKKGSVLIDVGAHSTSVMIFSEGILKFVQTLDQGGHYFTQAIAHKLNLNFDLAEDIKKSYVGALDEAVDGEEEILVKRDEGYVPVKRETICQVVDEAMQLMGCDVYKILLNSNLYNQINSGVVMVGGGALLPGFMEKIEQLSGLSVKMGILTQGLQNSVIYASCVGLAQGACTDSFRYTLASKTPQKWTTSLMNRVREIYYEYF